MQKTIKKLMIYSQHSLKGIMVSRSCKNAYDYIIQFPRWLNYLKPGRNSMADQMPWISFSAIKFLKKTMHKNDTVYEAGSGGSTLFWSNHVKEVISIEHDEAWYQDVQKRIRSDRRENIRYQLIQSEEDPDYSSKSISNPNDYISEDENHIGKNFKSYASHIDQFPDESFDFVLIDGRARPSCLLHAMPKVKSDGFLVLDNSERNYYLKEMKELTDRTKWKRTDFYGPVPYILHFSQTSFFKKLNE